MSYWNRTLFRKNNPCAKSGAYPSPLPLLLNSSGGPAKVCTRPVESGQYVEQGPTGYVAGCGNDGVALVGVRVLRRCLGLLGSHKTVMA